MSDDATHPATPEATPNAPPPRRDDEALRNLLLFLPRLAKLIAQLLVDAQVAATDKMLLGAVVIYIASPIDIVPDVIPMIGQLDDLYLVAMCLLRLMNRSGENTLRQYWDGPEDIVAVLAKVTDFATRYLPEPVRGQIRQWVDVRSSEPPASG